MGQIRTKSRNYTLFEKNDKVIHLPIEPAFCPVTRSILIETAKSLGIHVHQTGTAVVIEGPRFSTKAESNVYRSWNADLVNMTLAPEVSSLFDVHCSVEHDYFDFRLCWPKKRVCCTPRWPWPQTTIVGEKQQKKSTSHALSKSFKRT